MVGLIGDPPAKAEVYVVTVVSSAVILLRHHGDGVDLHQKLRAREPNGDGGGDRRRVGPSGDLPGPVRSAVRCRPFSPTDLSR